LAANKQILGIILCILLNTVQGTDPYIIVLHLKNEATVSEKLHLFRFNKWCNGKIFNFMFRSNNAVPYKNTMQTSYLSSAL
jgi:hypothetical protein